MHSTNPEHYLEKFTQYLSDDIKPIKHYYITGFNNYVLPKKEILKEQTIAKLNKVWTLKFRDIRKWTKPETSIDKIFKWKAFRYNKELNPKEKWFDYKKYGKIIWLGICQKKE